MVNEACDSAACDSAACESAACESAACDSAAPRFGLNVADSAVSQPTGVCGLRNDDFLLKSDDFLLKSDDLIMKTAVEAAPGVPADTAAGQELLRFRLPAARILRGG